MKTLTDGVAAARTSASRPETTLERLEPRQFMSVSDPTPVVRLETNVGRITLEMFPNSQTPITNANFLQYVNSGRYNNTVIHRSVPGFVVQGGGYAANADAGFSHIETFGQIQNEFSPSRGNVRGTVAMAKLEGDPNSATSEFFFNLADNRANLDNQNGGFTTFARVIGGGMNTVDAIARLGRRDASKLNSAFTDLPVVETQFSDNAVVITSATEHTARTVTIGAGTDRAVTWVDENGSTGTVTLTSGNADLKFVGNIASFDTVNGVVRLRGTDISLEDIATRGTSAATTLKITSRGGAIGMGNIVADGSLGTISAKTSQMQGNITAAGSINRIDLRSADASTITVGSGSGALVVNFNAARDTSIDSQTPLASLKARRWVETGSVTQILRAPSIEKVDVKGDYSPTLSTTAGGLGTFRVSGDVGSGVWAVTGDVGSIRAGNVAATISSTGAIGALSAKSLQGGSITAASIGTLSVNGNVANTTIRTSGNIGSVSAATLSGSKIYAGVRSTVTGIPSVLSEFANPAATIGRLTLRRAATSFSNTVIAVPIAGNLNLGVVKTSNNGTQHGIVADQIGSLTATTDTKKQIRLRNVTDDAQVTTYFSAQGIVPGDFKIDIV